MKLKGLRWWIIGLVCLATIINYIDRSALSIMWEFMVPDLGFSQQEADQLYATVGVIFTIAYSAGKFISGAVYDKVGTRIGFVLSIFFWSVASIMHFFTRGLATLGLFRGVLAVAEAGNWPGAVKNNGEWFPVKERALAQGIFNTGAAVGSIISAPAIAALYEAYGWRWAFVIIGALGLLWIIPWLIINKAQPAKHAWITDEEREYILSDQPKVDPDALDTSDKMSINEILSFKESWGVLITRFFIEPVWWFFLVWLPIYLVRAYEFNIKDLGAKSWFPYLGAAIGSIVGGMVAKKLLNNNSLDKTRKKIITIGILIALAGIITSILFSLYADSAEMFLLASFIVLFGFQFAIGNIQTLPSDLLPSKSVGSLAGLSGTVGAISVAIVTAIVPKVISTPILEDFFTGSNVNSVVISFLPLFILLGVLCVLALVSLFIFVKEIKPLAK